MGPDPVVWVRELDVDWEEAGDVLEWDKQAWALAGIVCVLCVALAFRIKQACPVLLNPVQNVAQE